VVQRKNLKIICLINFFEGNNLNLNTMKTRILILTAILFVLNSCIVKSLHPFFTDNTKVNLNELQGKWTDKGEGIWEVVSFEKEIMNYNYKNETDENGVKVKVEATISEADKKELEKFKNALLVKYTNKKKEEATFMATPFKIEDQLFLDFTPFLEGFEEGNSLAKYHLIGTHSLVKVDFTELNQVDLKWFDEDIIKELLDEERIKIKHEKIGFDNTYLLTATPEELTKFVKKYMKSPREDKWKTSVKYKLTKFES
jgi:hypothetical protein